VAQDEIRLLLEEELARESPPPIGDLVGASVRQGRRMRRIRNVWTAGGGAVAVACLMVGVLVLVGALPGGIGAAHHGSGGGQRAAGAPAASAVPEAGTNPAGVATQPAPTAPKKVASGVDKVPATPQGMVELLSQLLPPGRRTAAGKVSDGSLMVALNLDRGRGVGMVRVSVQSGPASAPGCHDGATCRTLPDNSFVENRDFPDNCIEYRTVLLVRPDGIAVFIMMPSCLSWNGKTNPPGQVVLSVDEAIAIADDPRWGTEMPRSLVEAGQQDYPQLSTFG
jgi:hypothetical protein